MNDNEITTASFKANQHAEDNRGMIARELGMLEKSIAVLGDRIEELHVKIMPILAPKALDNGVRPADMVYGEEPDVGVEPASGPSQVRNQINNAFISISSRISDIENIISCVDL